MSGFCCVCHVFPPLVSIFGLFPVLVWCDYWLILVQPCLSNYLWLTCVFIVLSVHFDFVWSIRYSRCFLSVSLALSWLKTVIWVYVLVSVFLVPPCCVHRDRRPDLTVSGAPSPRFAFSVFYKVLFLFLCVCLSRQASPHARRSREISATGCSYPKPAGWISSSRVAAPRACHSRQMTPPSAAHRARRSRLTDPAVRGRSRRRPAADSMPAGSPLTQARRITTDSSPPDRRWLKPAGSPLTLAPWIQSKRHGQESRVCLVVPTWTF